MRGWAEQDTTEGKHPQCNGRLKATKTLQQWGRSGRRTQGTMDTDARWAGTEQQAALRGLSPAPSPQDAAVWAAGRSAVCCELCPNSCAGSGHTWGRVGALCCSTDRAEPSSTHQQTCTPLQSSTARCLAG